MLLTITQLWKKLTVAGFNKLGSFLPTPKVLPALQPVQNRPHPIAQALRAWSINR